MKIGKKLEILQDAKKNNGMVVTKGTLVSIEFDKENLGKVVCHTIGGEKIKFPVIVAYKYVKGFPKPPTMEKMMKWQEDGFCKSILGERVEPDGIDAQGSPSWLLALGFI